MSKFLSSARRSGVTERTSGARVTGVVISGDKAKVKVAFREASGVIQLLKENGDWRFGANAIAPG